MQGVPLRVEIGAKDVANGQVTLKSRIADTKRTTAPLNTDTAAAIAAQLEHVQSELLARASARLAARTVWVPSYAAMRDALAAGNHSLTGPAFFLVPWCANDANEIAIKNDCKATLRCYPVAEQVRLTKGMKCFYDSAADATHIALFARAV